MIKTLLLYIKFIPIKLFMNRVLHLMGQMEECQDYTGKNNFTFGSIFVPMVVDLSALEPLKIEFQHQI